MPRKTKAAEKARTSGEGYAVQSGDAAVKIVGCLAAGILPDGGRALVEYTEELKHGDLAALRRPDKTLGLFRVYDVAGDRVFVSISSAETPDGSDYAPVFADNMPFEIVGKVIGIQFAE